MIAINYFHSQMKTYTIILLAALFLLAHTQSNNQKCIHRNKTASNSGSRYLSTSISQTQNNRYSSGHSGSSGYVPYCEDLEALEEAFKIVIGIFVAVIIIVLAIGGLIFWRVMVRVKKTEKIRNQMLMKKQEFASQHSLNLYEANSFQTIHV